MKWIPTHLCERAFARNFVFDEHRRTSFILEGIQITGIVIGARSEVVNARHCDPKYHLLLNVHRYLIGKRNEIISVLATSTNIHNYRKSFAVGFIHKILASI